MGIWVCSPGPLIGGIPALINDGKLMSSYGGAISITMPGQGKIMT